MDARQCLEHVLQNERQLEFAVLVGSRATGAATAMSDWDIAVRWCKDLTAFETLERSERLRQRISHATGIGQDKIDLIDLGTARLAMRALVAEEGIVLSGGDSLAWHHFLTRTWAELEDFYWRKSHAA